METFKDIVLAGLLLLCPFFASGEVKWLSTDYNYGAFKEAEGAKKGSVQFVNTGSKPTFISNVRSSCGCTGVEYPEDMIQPGDTATIGFIYNPEGRPGPFDKTVKVYIGKENTLQVIRISGTVIGSPSTLESSYPYQAGPLRFETIFQPMGEVKKGGSRHVFINIYNQGTDTIRPVWKDGKSALETNLTPKALAPGEIGTLGFYLNTVHEKKMGPVEYLVGIRPDKSSSDEDGREIRITASIVPDSRTMTVEEIENSPRAYLVPEFVDFGENVTDLPAAFEFEILNDGKAPLEVSRVYSYNEGVEVSSYPKKIKGKEKLLLKGMLKTDKLPAGPFRIQIEVITNDPLHPVRTANLVGIKQGI